MTISKKRTTKAIGDAAEHLAAEFLIARGYRLKQKNYRAGRGEIDLIMDDAGTLVFVEVKARKNTEFGLPQEAVTRQKQRQIIQTAYRYLIENDLVEINCRFDVVALTLQQPAPKIEHFPAAFIATPADFDNSNP